ncbi:hypothetical protein PROFUN_10118 [Planoprotostelium fungivorum]|uniref:Uncharacterized protein n=1 Tax=Planoprotostelium fungivorum TaxID=1890364 RepID=A0A2P6NEP1_9EUKA|nr:hypothetical protein PROFUN_10118 [Planoprotostelium fungivorum]
MTTLQKSLSERSYDQSFYSEVLAANHWIALLCTRMEQYQSSSRVPNVHLKVLPYTYQYDAFPSSSDNTIYAWNKESCSSKQDNLDSFREFLKRSSQYLSRYLIPLSKYLMDSIEVIHLCFSHFVAYSPSLGCNHLSLHSKMAFLKF